MAWQKDQGWEEWKAKQSELHLEQQSAENNMKYVNHCKHKILGGRFVPWGPQRDWWWGVSWLEQQTE
jgi:hypothetical protein